MLIKRHRVPFATFGGEEITAIDMDGSGQAVDRVDHRMNDVGAKRYGILFAKRSCARRFDSSWRLGDAPPEYVVLATRIDADDGPHLVIVGHHHHAGCPHHVYDG